MKRKEQAIEAAVLLAASSLIYAVLFGGALVYDDEIYVAADRIFNWRALFSRDYFTLTDERSFQPLVTALQLLAAGNADLLRGFGVLLHAANGVLVGALGRAAGLHPSAAFAAAVLFVLFPPATEVVAVASFHGHLIVCFATLSALLAWLSGKRGLSLAALGLGLLSKESAVVIGPLILLCELFFPSRKTRSARVWIGILAAATGLYLSFRFLVLAPPPPFELPPAASPAGTLGWYASSLAVPWPLCIERTAADSSIGAFVLWVIGAVLIFARGRAFALWVWPALALLPVLHFLPFANYSPVADRYLYAASAPLALFLCGIFYGPRGRIALAMVALLWGAGSVYRTAFFREPGRLYRQTAACAPDNPRAHALLGGWLYRVEDRAEKALSSFDKAFVHDPDMISHFSDPGLVHRQPPSYVRGMLLLRLNRAQEAAPLLLKAVLEAKSPINEAAARSKWGDALAALGRTKEAIGQQLRAQVLLPAWAMPPLKLAVLHMDPRPKLALKNAKHALERSPTDQLSARILSVKGDAHWRLKQSKKAEDAWRQSLSLVAFQPATMAALADLLEADGRGAEAESLRTEIRALLPLE